MKVAIMQPYFFPYIGYFQLINAVDVFVVYDDVNFIKQSWITRNRILLMNEEFRINLVVEKASSFKKINQIDRVVENKKWLKTIEQGYKKAPFFHNVYPLIQEIALIGEKNLSEFLLISIISIAKYLEIKTTIKLSSDIVKDNNLKGQDKVVAICKELNSSNYINAIGGQSLYQTEHFQKNGIGLHFLKSNSIVYQQFNNPFIPWLSIIDVLMFNKKEDVKALLNQYILI